MPQYLVSRAKKDVDAVRAKGNHEDSRTAAWYAINRGSEVIYEIQLQGAKKKWTSLKDALPVVNPEARALLDMRLEAIHTFKQSPHCRHGFRPSRHTGDARP